MDPPPPPDPNVVTNKAIRGLAGMFGILCALLIVGGVCSFFTRSASANLFLLLVAFGGAIAGWAGHRQKPKTRDTIFFGQMKYANSHKNLMVDPGYPALSAAALLVGLCMAF